MFNEVTVSSADQVDMAPFTAWLLPHSTQDFDLVVKVAGSGAPQLRQDWLPLAHLLVEEGLAVMAERLRPNGDVGNAALHVRMTVQSFYDSDLR